MKLSSNSLTYLVKRQIKSPPTHLLQGHNEMQGYHQNKSQISIHPIVVYYVSNNVLAPSSLCILSDDFEHDVSFVSKLFHETVFFNLFHPKNDFSVDCVWNFFANSHAKSSCDGTCGTAKRLTASLQHQVPDILASNIFCKRHVNIQ